MHLDAWPTETICGYQLVLSEALWFAENIQKRHKGEATVLAADPPPSPGLEIPGKSSDGSNH